MKEQAERISRALKSALQMEVEGKEFYNKSGQMSDNPLAKQLFLRLAKAEDIHIQKINEIYKTIQIKTEWPKKETTFKHEKSIKSVFKEAIAGMDKNSKASSSELEAFKTAINMEDKSYGFYTSRDAEATTPAEKSFYKSLTAEEREHYLLLLDSYEYFTDPQGWLIKNEHWGLDGA